MGKHKHKKSWAHNGHQNIALLHSNIGTNAIQQQSSNQNTKRKDASFPKWQIHSICDFSICESFYMENGLVFCLKLTRGILKENQEEQIMQSM